MFSSSENNNGERDHDPTGSLESTVTIGPLAYWHLYTHNIRQNYANLSRRLDVHNESRILEVQIVRVVSNEAVN